MKIHYANNDKLFTYNAMIKGYRTKVLLLSDVEKEKKIVLADSVKTGCDNSKIVNGEYIYVFCAHCNEIHRFKIQSKQSLLDKKVKDD